MRSSYLLYVFCALLLLANCVQVVSAEGGYVYSTQWGSYGSADGQFLTPYAVAVDSDGTICVADKSSQQIQKFTPTGTFITRWNSSESGKGQIHDPFSAVDNAGNVYVVGSTKWDPEGSRTNHLWIEKFDSSGTLVANWSSDGWGIGRALLPTGIVVDSAGYIYVADAGIDHNDRILKISSSGELVTKWGDYGPVDGTFVNIRGIAVDKTDNIYAVDTSTARIQKFTSTGTFITKWGSSGSGDGQFDHPVGIAVDGAGNVYVADTGNNRIQKFARAGTTPVVIVPGGSAVPRDALNNDGLYEDLNGNGALDFNDVVILFNQMDWIANNEPISAFDFNQNRRIDFNDVVTLFNEVQGPTIVTTTAVTTVIPTTIVTTTQNPPGTIWQIPTRIEAENYDLGGEGVAYHDTTSGNQGGFYRNDDADIEYNNGENSPVVCYIQAGEWLKYTVNVQSTTLYDVSFRVSSPQSGTTMNLQVDGSTVSQVTVPNTGSYDNYVTVTRQVSLAAGPHVLKLMAGGYQNLNWITFTARGLAQGAALPEVTVNQITRI